MAESYPDRRANVVAAAAVSMAIALIALALRFYSRAMARKANFWWDDWTALASAPFMIATTGLTIRWAHIGLGLHVAQATQYGNIHQWLLIFWVGNLTYVASLTLVKLSVILFYFRVFANVKRYRYVLWFATALVIAWFIAISFEAIFKCVPVRAYWTLEKPSKCQKSLPGFLGTTITNVFIDLVLLLIPLPMLWKLNLRMSRKISLLGIFICGYCVVVVSVVRLQSVVALGNKANTDITWYFVVPQTLVAIEVPIALFSSCLPANLQLIKHVTEKVRFGTAQSSKQLSNDQGLKMGRLGNPIDDKSAASFVRLDSQKSDHESVERLYAGPETA